MKTQKRKIGKVGKGPNVRTPKKTYTAAHVKSSVVQMLSDFYMDDYVKIRLRFGYAIEVDFNDKKFLSHVRSEIESYLNFPA